MTSGDVVAVDGVPTRYAQPVAEVNRLDDGRVELVFIEKSVVGDHGVRVAGLFADHDPVALIRDVEPQIADTLERWLASMGTRDD